jgi:hypothetical protein
MRDRLGPPGLHLTAARSLRSSMPKRLALGSAPSSVATLAGFPTIAPGPAQAIVFTQAQVEVDVALAATLRSLSRAASRLARARTPTPDR